MRWVRKNIRYGSWCALLAVAIHIVVSFGHAHRFDPLRQGGLLPAVAGVVYAPPAGEPGGPPPQPIGLALDYCAICAVINLAAAMMPATAPGSNVPLVVSRLEFSPYAEAARRTLAHPNFRARAPPLS